jgi:USP6 N-terminal-like protein
MSAPSLVVRQLSSRQSLLPSELNRNTSPDLSLDQERSSSETQTIFTIYSMYSDDNAGSRASWSASEDINVKVHDPGLPDASNASFLPNRHSTTDLAHDHILADMPPHDHSLAFLESVVRPGASPHLQATNAFPGKDSVIRQNMATTVAPLIHRDSHFTGIPRSRSSSRSPSPSPSRPLPRPPSFHQSRDPSPVPNGGPLGPASVEPLSGIPRISISPQPPTPPPKSPPDPSRLRPSHTLPLSKPKHPLTPPLSSLSSKTSLVPSEGEDPDAFHVRNTYAQLDVRGVKGDGYEEGVERTRARIGDSVKSQMDAEKALGDGTEKMQTLSTQELDFLATVDRCVVPLSDCSSYLKEICSYGFFDIATHDRLVLLPSSPLQKRLSRTRAGPPNAPTSAVPLASIPPAPVSSKESTRITKWNRMLLPARRDTGKNVETWSLKPSKMSKIRERTYKGIPDRWRSAVWDMFVRQETKSGKRDMDILEERYRADTEKPSSYDIQIDLDVPRTISGHVMFRTRYGAGCVLFLSNSSISF